MYCIGHSRGRPRTIGCDALKWVRPAELPDYAFPKGDRVVLEALQQDLGGQLE